MYIGIQIAGQLLYGSMAAYTFVFCTLVGVIKINSVKTQLSFQASTILINADTAEFISMLKIQTDRQLSALYSRLVVCIFCIEVY